MISKGILFRLHHGKRKSAASSQGVFQIELPDELSWTTGPNGHAVRMPVVNLLCCERSEAENRAEDVIRQREIERELFSKENNRENNMSNTLMEYADKDGAYGNPLKVWDRYLSHICGGLVKAKGASKADVELLSPNVRKAMYRRQGVLSDFAKWYGKPLTQVDADVVASYVAAKENEDGFDAESFKKEIVDVLSEIWKVSLPMSENHWGNVKYDVKRDVIVAQSSLVPSAESLLRTSLLEFAELYFRNEAASGRKWEDNTRGFITHLMEHTGVRNVGDVTRTVALDYAIALHNDGDAKVARSGRDRLSKLCTMWNTMMPELENPWKDVSYETAMMARKFNDAVQKHESVDNISKRFHCTDPHALFAEYATLHKFKPHRFSTVRAIFLRMWNNTGIKCPSDLTREMAFNYVSEIRRNKKSWEQDRSEISTMWYVCFPGYPNYWDETVERARMTQIRKGEISFSQSRSDAATASARLRRESGEFDRPAAPPVDGDTHIEPQSSESARKTDVKRAIDDLVTKTGTEDFLEEPFRKKVAAPAAVNPAAPSCSKVLRGRMPIAQKLEYGLPMTFNEVYLNWKRNNRNLKKETCISYHNRWNEVERYCTLHDIHQLTRTSIDVAFVRQFTSDVMPTLAKSTKLTFISIAKNIWEASFPDVENPWKTVYMQVNSEPDPVLMSDHNESEVEPPKADSAEPKEAEASATIPEDKTSGKTRPDGQSKVVIGEPKPVVPVDNDVLVKTWGYKSNGTRRKSWVRRLFEKVFSWF